MPTLGGWLGIKGHPKQKHFSLKTGSLPWLTSKPLGNFVNIQMDARAPPQASHTRVPRGGVGVSRPRWSCCLVRAEHPCLIKFQLTPSASENSGHTKDHIKDGALWMVFPLLIMTQPKHFSPAPFTCLRVLRKVNLSICQYLLCLLPSTEEGKTVFPVERVFIQRICKLSQSYGKSITLS